jgi:hypothetical protein
LITSENGANLLQYRLFDVRCSATTNHPKSKTGILRKSSGFGVFAEIFSKNILVLRKWCP